MAATLSFSSFSLDHAGPTKKLKDFLQESNGNGKPRTPSFKAIHAVVVAAVRRISFPMLPRTLSRRLSGKRDGVESDVVVKVKDIIRWRSFRDLVDETAATTPESPDSYTAAGTTTTATSSNSSSWCESDFTAEDLLSPSWRGCSDDGGDGCVGEDSTKTTAEYEENDRKEKNALSRCDDKEKEQKVLKGMARRLSAHVEGTISLSNSREAESHCLDWQLLELLRRGPVDYSQESEANEKRSATKVKEDENGYEWFFSQKGKEGYLREMEREGKWEVFGVEEKVELGLEIEGEILGCLVDDILLDIFQL